MHHRLTKQTQGKLLVVFHRHCLHMTSTREANRHHMCVAVLESKLKVAGYLGTAGSTCPQVFPAVMCKLTSGLAACTLCSAVEYSMHLVRMVVSTCSFDLAQAA